MSAAGVSKLNAGRLLLLCGALVLAVLVGCEGDSDGPLGPLEEITPPVSTSSAVLSDFFVSTSEITAGEMDTLIAYVVDLQGEPLEGASVLFATSLGQFPNGRSTTSATSSLSGIASVRLLTSLADSGQAVVEASLNGIVRRAAIVIMARPGTAQTARVDRLTVKATPQVVVADGGVSSCTITARATTAEGAAVPGVPVDFAATAGFVVSPVETDTRGEAVTSLYSSDFPATALVTATADGVKDSVYVDFVASSAIYILELSAAPDVIRADGGQSFSVISARLLDEDHHPVKGASVSFETNLGFIDASATTDDDGLATANLHSDDEAGVATVTASFGDETETVQVVFSPYEEPTPYKLDLLAVPTTLPADGGSSKSEIVATVLNSKNNPLVGVTVEFQTTLGMIDASGVTNSAGQFATVLYSASQAGTAAVTASVGSLSKTVNVAMVSLGDFYDIGIKAAPTAIFADGGRSTSQISATLTTSQGNPVEGALLFFTTTAGQIEGSALTDSLGTATAALRSSSTAVTATVRATFATTFYAETTVQMLPLDAPVFTIEVRSSRSQVQVKGTGGIESADITAMAYDVLGNPSPNGTQVTFRIVEAPGTDESLANSGFGPVTVATVEGAASVPFRAGTASGTVVIRVSAGGLVTDVTPLTVASGPPAKINLCAAKLNVSYCYHEPNSICGYVCDVYNNPVANGTAVFLTVNKGCITPTAETQGEVFEDENGNGKWDKGEPFDDSIENGVYDARGVIGAEWTDCGPGPFGAIGVTAETSGGTVTGTFSFISSGCPASVLFVLAGPSAIFADGKSQSIVRFKVLDGNGFFVTEGTPVFFSTTLGVIDPDTSFTRDGVHESVALATLTSEILTQDYSLPVTTSDDGIGAKALVTAESNFAMASTLVSFTTGHSDLVKSKLQAPSPMGVSARAIVTAAMKDFYQNPLGAHQIEFYCSDGLFDNGLNMITAYTGAAGVANAIYFAPADTNTVVISIRDRDARGGNLGLNKVITVR